MQLLLNGLIAGSLAALVAGGLALVYGVLGVFNLALGQIVLVGGYVTWWLYEGIGWSFMASIAGGIIAGGLVTWITFRIFVEPFYKRHRFLPIVTTIALSMILDGLILILFGESPKSIRLGGGIWHIAGARISVAQLGLILITILLLSVLAYTLHSTAIGRRIRAVVQHPHAVESFGVPAQRLHQLLFIMSGILASCGGIFLAIDQNLTPVLAFSITIKAYAAIIAGGKGNVWGAIVCAYAIALLEQAIVGIHWFNTFYVPAGFQGTVALAVIIIFLIIRPQGLFGSVARSA